MNGVEGMLLRLWRDPALALELAEADWDALVRVADAAGLLGQIGERLAEFGYASEVPANVWRHFDAACMISEAHQRNVRWEVRRVAEALGSIGLPFLVLKGTAYVLAGLGCARGRVFEDVDVLVPRSSLERAESALSVHGWITMHRHPYDQRYYRRWMHELPPMRHVRRGTTLDVHHTLLPVTAPIHPDASRIWDDSCPLPNWRGVFQPCPEDLVLHSSAHLFFDGAFENGLRDLIDIDQLLRHFGQISGFWDALGDRARMMELTVPLDDAIYWANRLLATPVPQELLAQSSATGRPRWRRAFMRPVFRAGLRPDHPLCRSPGTQLARGILYARSHFLRMPPRLAVPHLLRKAIRPVEPERA